jgi:hypothetical protein
MAGVTTRGTLKRAIIGMILGDGYMQMHDRNARLETSSICLPYIKWKKEFMEKFTSVKIYEKKGWKSENPIYRAVTLNHPVFTKLYYHCYHDGRKTVDDFVLKQVDGLSLLIWFLDDGNFYKSKRSKGEMQIGLATHNFTYAENLLIQKVMNDKLGLRWNLQQQWRKDRNKRYYFLQLKAKDRLRFYYLIEPYVKYVPMEMLYKIPTKTDIMSSRTRYEDIV